MDNIPVNEILKFYYMEHKSPQDIADYYNKIYRINISAVDISQIIPIYYKMTGKTMPKRDDGEKIIKEKSSQEKENNNNKKEARPEDINVEELVALFQEKTAEKIAKEKGLSIFKVNGILKEYYRSHPDEVIPDHSYRPKRKYDVDKIVRMYETMTVTEIGRSENISTPTIYKILNDYYKAHPDEIRPVKPKATTGMTYYIDKKEKEANVKADDEKKSPDEVVLDPDEIIRLYQKDSVTTIARSKGVPDNRVYKIIKEYYNQHPEAEKPKKQPVVTPKVTDEMIEKIGKLFETKTSFEVAREMDVSTTTVYKALKKYYELHPEAKRPEKKVKNYKIDNSLIEEVGIMYRTMSAEEIARQKRLSAPTIYKALEEYYKMHPEEVRPVKPKGYQGIAKKLGDGEETIIENGKIIYVEEIVELYQNKTAKEISEEINIPCPKIYEIVNEYYNSHPDKIRPVKPRGKNFGSKNGRSLEAKKTTPEPQVEKKVEEDKKPAKPLGDADDKFYVDEILKKILLSGEQTLDRWKKTQSDDHLIEKMIERLNMFERTVKVAKRANGTFVPDEKLMEVLKILKNPALVPPVTKFIPDLRVYVKPRTICKNGKIETIIHNVFKDNSDLAAFILPQLELVYKEYDLGVWNTIRKKYEDKINNMFQLLYTLEEAQAKAKAQAQGKSNNVPGSDGR